MNISLEILQKKFGTSVEKVWEESEKQFCILVKEASLVELIGCLTRELGMRFVFLFASDERKEEKSFYLRYVFSNRSEDQFLILMMRVHQDHPVFPSVTPWIPQANWHEREIQDLFGIQAKNHPDPRRLVLHEDWPDEQYPLRKDFDSARKIARSKGNYAFEQVEGEGVFEIPVGPVHAGIIEPGHFRFSSAGESILKLEIRHFYKHKGIEKLGEGKTPHHLISLAERISGDNSVAHAAACAQALETLSGIEISKRAQFLRVIFLELERVYNHLADISGIVLDVAFGFGAAQFTRIRERLMRLNEHLSGSRLLRSVITFGGVRKDLTNVEIRFLTGELKAIKADIDSVVQILWNVSSLLDRVHGTGIIKKEIALALGGTGPIARASGIERDLRRDHAYLGYQELLFMVPVFDDGDVESRMKVKIQEMYESIKLIHEAAELLPLGAHEIQTKSLAPSKSALGYAESPRGECFHWVATDRQGCIARWKIHSPSFANWPLIEYAVLENIVPDFPVINKSMNLSYSGNDR